MTATPRNLLTVWARAIAASLVASGVRDVVVSPGSRSTPFVLALHARPELRLTSVIDERAAAFVALGMARATGLPAAVIATSGTAPAHWLPAVIESSLAHVPLVLLSANRPMALAGTGAAQTIDQTKLFGSWTRLFVDVGDPRDDEQALVGLALHVAQAVAIARGPNAGPVHLDLRADKPLEPVEASTDVERALVETAARALRRVPEISFSPTSPDDAFARRLAEALARATRPLIVAGPRRERGDEAAIHAACERLGLVLAPEATSQLRFGPRSGHAIDASEVMFARPRFAAEHAPDLVLQIGSFPTAPTIERAWAGATRFVLDAGDVHDPMGGAAAISVGPAGATLARTAELATKRERDAAWRASLERADAIAWGEVERSIASGRGEGAVVRAAVAAAPSATLFVGNSLPIRTLDRFVPGGGASRRVLSQRGANGIDGLVSGPIGAAIGSEQCIVAILGDVSFVHDLNALSAAASVRSPLVVVVVDNGGGRIFDALPIARIAETSDAMPLFTTPHGIDLSAATRAFGVACVVTRDAAETARAVRAAHTTPGLCVVRAMVEPHDARESFEALVASFEARFFGASS